MLLGKASKKIVKLWLLAKLRGGGLEGPRAQPIYHVSFMVQNDVTAPKHKKKTFYPPSPPPQFPKNSSRILKEFDDFVCFFRVYHMGHKYFIKLFHVLGGIDFNKTIMK